MSTVETNNADGEENVELSDDFFDEFEDTKFLDEIVEVIVPEKLPLIRTDNAPNENSTETHKSNNEQLTEDEPILKRCLDEINNLTKSIERRKRRLRGELNASDNSKCKRRSDSTSTSRSDRNARSRDRRLSPRSPRSRRDRSRSRDRIRSRDRRVSRGRRDRSRSGTPANNSRGLSFLDELEQKFAEKGQDFPEKHLLMQMRGRENGTTGMNPYPATLGYSQCEAPMLPFIQNLPMQMPMPMPMYGNAVAPYPHQWNGNYLCDPMMSMQHTMQTIPIQPTCANNPTNTFIAMPLSNKAEIVAKCRAASKILRGEENKVPKLKFLFTRTSVPVEPSEEKAFPLQSRKNVEFEQTSDKQKPLAPLQFLPPRARELVKLLGYDCASIFSRLKLKEFADKVIHEADNIDAEKKRTKEVSYKECEIQTESYKCPSCINRESKAFLNKFIQTEAPKKVSIRTQTNEKDYREPLIRSLTRMTAGQLVAVSDFANLICEPRPSTSTEVYSVREKLMDIYNLSERGPEAIEAERTREQEIWRRGINNSISGHLVEDLRATIRGTSEHNMGRVPPPPPLLSNYQMEVGMMDERENRLQQLRFEENRRQLQMEEQRKRELEWEHQLQLQREEENARLEMQNDRRNNFGRGMSQWNGSRGRY